MIKGLQKVTLIDYPGKIACTIFISGCNFRCGYCYNSDLVFNSKNIPNIPEKEIIEFLKSRINLLEGVCITGGEPTLYKNLVPLLKKIKKLGYCVKLDTNGSNPEAIQDLLNKKLLDYIAMDVKSSLDSYPKITNSKINKVKLRKSIELIKNSGIDYEFRTTVVPDIINKNEVASICSEIRGAKKYFLQQFMANEKTIDKKYNSMRPLKKESLELFREIALDQVENTKIRA
ncbi:anaerobic ribonucleoside-triphosphate reductase activating protein [Candidatus Woesearchaeota archaeon]|nr:anaerobic ribonucleoside-triphosphate reductase activating protein [Candidatus Woesearchaeota archaeon]